MNLKCRLILEDYRKQRDDFIKLGDTVHSMLSDTVKELGLTVLAVEHRVKEEKSLAGKLERKGDGYNTFEDITDILGCRVICFLSDEVDKIGKKVAEKFVVDWENSSNKKDLLKENAFGYLSLHYICSLPFGDKWPDEICGKKFEIQIRTILQDAWAEVEHELIYKTEFTPFDMPLKRKLASMNASLSLADIIFQEIRDYQKNLQVEMNERHRSFYEKADELTSTHSDQSKASKNIERLNPYIRGTIDDMLLEAIHAHNNQQLDTAIEIYTRIIESKPTPNNIVLSVIHKHRGMAYFSKNDFENALNDFDSSFELDNSSFRAIYYKGIVFSIQKKFRESIDCFTKSLELNEYQSHTYFRRALAFYELGEYENSMSDLIAAQKLGLPEEETKNLHNKLIEKFDMKM